MLQKRYVSLIKITFFFCFVAASAQEKNVEGIIYYTGNTDIISKDNKKEQQKKANQSNPEKERILKLLHQKTTKENYTLKFNSNESSFEMIEALNRDEGRFNMTKSLSSKNIYIKGNQVFNQKEAYGDLFIIKSDLDAIVWDITEETKKIEGYLCYKAETKDIMNNNKMVIAWFCPSLSYKLGPAGYGNLPGLILELNVRDFMYRFVKIETSADALVKEKIKVPKKGKEVTVQEFKAIGTDVMNAIKNRKKRM